ncbi:MAG: RidA family protein [Candidatus Dadabacteria bacterium]|nr:MAG: RidA family protein [Candidatus Dadabacteria bacterium]
MTVKYLNSAENAPEAIGPYSQAASFGNLYFLSGQIAIDPSEGKMITGGIEEQTRRVMQNLKNVLASCNLSFNNVIKTTIYLKSLSDFQSVNQIYAEWMGECRPARATVEVAALPLNALVEIEMVAVKKND